MAAIPFPVSSAPGVRPQEGAGRLINCFAEKTEPGARFPVVWRRSAGLSQVVDVLDHVHLRGAISTPSTLVAVFDDRAYAINESGGAFTATDLGAIAGSDPITIASNNAATPNIVCVTAEGAKNLFTGSAPSDFADADLPQPNSVSELHGYFLFTIGDGRIFATGLNGVSVATNSFTTEQSLGGLLRGVTFQDQFYAFGPKGAGVYHDVGTAPFPLERQSFFKQGLCGTFAIAGWEPGWVNELIWAGPDGNPYQLVGSIPQPVGNDDVVRTISAAIKAGQGASLEASVYMQGKHAFWRLTNPGLWTWEYDVTTQNWNERRSHDRDDCRGATIVHAYDRWLSGDRESGKLFDIDPLSYREGSDPLRFIIRSGAGAQFPSPLQIPRMDFDFTVGVGVASGDDPIEVDPTVLIRWSKDGGASFGNPVQRKLGKQGEADQRVTVLRGPTTGPKGVVIELEVADPVHVAFMGGQMAALGLTE